MGLDKTSHGKPKIVDIVDATGSGDVDTSTVKEAVAGGEVVGLSGRTLKLGNWNIPNGKVHLGVKSAYELFPAPLVRRVKQERQKDWEKQTLATRVELQRKVDAAAAGDERKEAQLILDEFNAIVKSSEDPGAVYDCVVFFDGKLWRAVVDEDGSGDLTKRPQLADYREELQYSTFSDVDLMNYSVNIYDEGNILSLVTTCGSRTYSPVYLYS